LTLIHIGEADPARRASYNSGWPGKLAALGKQLSTARGDARNGERTRRPGGTPALGIEKCGVIKRPRSSP
jgi:hypothetical protein